MKKLENIVVFLLTMLVVYAILTLKLYASIIPVPNYAPDLTVPCDGLQYDAHCLPGTIVYFIWEPPYGFVPQTMQLPFPRVENPPVVVESPLPPLIEIPIPEIPREVPMVAATPEPSLRLFLWIAIFVVLGIRIKLNDRW